MTGRLSPKWPGLAEVVCDQKGCIDSVDLGGQGEDEIQNARDHAQDSYGWTYQDGKDYCDKHSFASEAGRDD